MLKILLVDDHSVVRAGVKQILLEANFTLEIGESSDAKSALKMVKSESWDLVLLDIRLPDRSGVELFKQLKLEKPKLPLLILSSYPESQYAVRLINLGAAGYLSKDAENNEIINAVRITSRGRKYLSPIVAKLLAEHITRDVNETNLNTLHETLSDREYQVFLELAVGLGPNCIAEKLNVSAKTITTHRSRILHKMNLSNNAELVLYAYEHNLLH